MLVSMNAYNDNLERERRSESHKTSGMTIVLPLVMLAVLTWRTTNVKVVTGGTMYPGSDNRGYRSKITEDYRKTKKRGKGEERFPRYKWRNDVASLKTMSRTEMVAGWKFSLEYLSSSSLYFGHFLVSFCELTLGATSSGKRSSRSKLWRCVL